MDYEPILAQMGTKRRRWAHQYREFVENGLAKTDERITRGKCVSEDVAFRRIAPKND